MPMKRGSWGSTLPLYIQKGDFFAKNCQNEPSLTKSIPYTEILDATLLQPYRKQGICLNTK